MLCSLLGRPVAATLLSNSSVSVSGLIRGRSAVFYCAESGWIGLRHKSIFCRVGLWQLWGEMTNVSFFFLFCEFERRRGTDVPSETKTSAVCDIVQGGEQGSNGADGGLPRPRGLPANERLRGKPKRE